MQYRECTGSCSRIYSARLVYLLGLASALAISVPSNLAIGSPSALAIGVASALARLGVFFPPGTFG